MLPLILAVLNRAFCTPESLLRTVSIRGEHPKFKVTLNSTSPALTSRPGVEEQPEKDAREPSRGHRNVGAWALKLAGSRLI